MPTKVLLVPGLLSAPSKTSSSPAQIKKRVKLAHKKAYDMVSSCFESNEDHKCIKVAMDNSPTIAIFFCQVVDQQKELVRKCSNNKNQFCKSILDLKDTSSLHCLAAVNYFPVGTKMVVL
jgi:hypothetical protein